MDQVLYVKIAVQMDIIPMQASTAFLVSATASDALDLPALNAIHACLKMTLSTEWVLLTVKGHVVLDTHSMLLEEIVTWMCEFITTTTVVQLALKINVYFLLYPEPPG